jgi:2-keto-3-deoxy-L-rhamnonate aldolase RhmA
MMSEHGIVERIRAGETTCGLWVRLASSEVTELAADAGLDWVCLDLEHGHLGWDDVHRHLSAAHGTGLGVLVRIPALELQPLKRALDLGADAVLLPLVRSADEVRWAVDNSRYPPHGHRTLGQERAMRWGRGTADYVARVARGGMVIPIVETPEAADAIEAIVAVDGIDAIFIGTGDLSASRGFVGQWEAPEVAAEVERIRAAAAAHGRAVGVVTGGPDDLRERRRQGYGVLGLGYDTDCLRYGMAMLQEAARAGQDGATRTSTAKERT